VDVDFRRDFIGGVYLSKIRFRDLIQVSLRLTLLQSSWCEGEMQSIGLAHCLLPGLRRFASSKDELNQSLQRRSEPFNTHPFLVGAIAGATLKLEEEHRDNKEIALLLRNTMGPLAAVGDLFFRNALPIFVAVASSLAAIFGGVLAGIITLLVLFNSIHIFVRLSSVFIGFNEGYQVLERIARWLSPARANVLEIAAALGTGVVFMAGIDMFGLDESPWVSGAMGTGGLLTALGFMKWRPRLSYVIPTVLAVSIIAEVV
jgi:mannose/fructose/N-acetylgalactosamine-specific phosphotransferase system component IID